MKNASSVVNGISDQYFKLKTSSSHEKALLSIKNIRYAAITLVAILRQTAEKKKQLCRNVVKAKQTYKLQRVAADVPHVFKELFGYGLINNIKKIQTPRFISF